MGAHQLLIIQLIQLAIFMQHLSLTDKQCHDVHIRTCPCAFFFLRTSLTCWSGVSRRSFWSRCSPRHPRPRLGTSPPPVTCDSFLALSQNIVSRSFTLKPIFLCQPILARPSQSISHRFRHLLLPILGPVTLVSPWTRHPPTQSCGHRIPEATKFQSARMPCLWG